MRAAIPSIEQVIQINLTGFDPNAGVVNWTDILKQHADSIDESLQLNDPLYILYSPGTTGNPVHYPQGSGVLLQHLKEHAPQSDVKAGDQVFYYHLWLDDVELAGQWPGT